MCTVSGRPPPQQLHLAGHGRTRLVVDRAVLAVAVRRAVQNLSAAELHEEISQVHPEPTQWESARRALRGWNMEPTDEDCKLLLVLRKYMASVVIP